MKSIIVAILLSLFLQPVFAQDSQNAATLIPGHNNYVGLYNIGKVDTFGGNSMGKNYCFYSCSFENIVVTLDLDAQKSSFTTVYKERGLNGCPQATLPDQPMSGESDYLTYKKGKGKLEIFYKITSGPMVGFIVSYVGRIEKSGALIGGRFIIERPTVDKFKGYVLKMPVELEKK